MLKLAIKGTWSDLMKKVSSGWYGMVGGRLSIKKQLQKVCRPFFDFCHIVLLHLRRGWRRWQKSGQVCLLLSKIFTTVQTVQISNVNFRMPWSLEQHIFQFWGCIEFQSWQMQDPSKNVWGEADSPFAPLLDVFDIMGTRMCTRRISMSSFITEWKFTWTL